MFINCIKSKQNNWFQALKEEDIVVSDYGEEWYIATVTSLTAASGPDMSGLDFGRRECITLTS